MLLLLDWLINRFERNRKAIAISFFFFGSPIIYFLRDGIGLASGSIYFTAIFTFGSLFLAVPFRNTNRLYSFNKPFFSFIIVYWIIALLYLATYTPNRGIFTQTDAEIINFSVMLISAYIFASSSSSEFLNGFLKAAFWICLMGCSLLILSMLISSNYELSSRASISLGKDSEGVTMGNPHIYGRSAFAGLVASIILRNMNQSQLWKLFYSACTLIFIVVSILTQSFQTIIALMIFGLIFLYLRTNVSTLYFASRWIFGWKGLLTFIFISLVIYYYITYTDILVKVEHVSVIIGSRFEKIFGFIKFSQKNPFLTQLNVLTTDASALGRVETIQKVGKNIISHIENKEWWWLLIGNGYHSLYVDSPIIQTYNDLGIVGFSAYVGIHFYIIKYALREYRQMSHPSILFLSFFVIHTFVQNCVYAMPYDFYRWSLFIFLARILKDFKRVIPPVVP